MKTNTDFPSSEFTANDSCPECGNHFASGHDAECSKIRGKWGARSPQDQALLDRMPQANDSGPSLGKQLPGGHNLTVYSPHHADPVDEHQTRPGSNEVGPMLERGVVPGAGSDQHEWVHTHHGEPVNGGFENSGPEAMVAAEKSHKDLTQGFDMRELTGRRRRSGIPRDCPACDDQAFATAHENRYDEGRTNHKMTHDQAIEYADKHAQSDIPYVLEDMNCPHGRLSRRKQAWPGRKKPAEEPPNGLAGYGFHPHPRGEGFQVKRPYFDPNNGKMNPDAIWLTSPGSYPHNTGFGDVKPEEAHTFPTLDDAVGAAVSHHEIAPGQNHGKWQSQVTTASRKQAWVGWGPDLAEDTHHKVAGFEWDNHLNGFVSNVANPRIFECSCGAKHPVPSYANCKCGKIWNSYAVGTGGDRHEANLEKVICREVPHREGVIVASMNGDMASDSRSRGVRDLGSGTGVQSRSDSPSRVFRSTQVDGSDSANQHQRKNRNMSRVPERESRVREAPHDSYPDGSDVLRTSGRSSGEASQRAVSRQLAREPGVRNRPGQHARHGASRDSVATEEDALSPQAFARRAQSRTQPNAARASSMSSLRAGQELSQESSGIGSFGDSQWLLPDRHGSVGFDPRQYLVAQNHTAPQTKDLSFPSRGYALDDEVEDASPFPSDHHPKAGEATMRQPADDWHSRRQDGKWAPGGHQPKFRKSDS